MHAHVACQGIWWCLQNPAACVSASYALELVPWSCAVDISTWPGTLSCIPAYLQLVYTPGDTV